MANKRRLSEEQISALKDVISSFEKEDTAVRERQVRVARQLKMLWENLQYAWYDEVAHDWRIYDPQNTLDTDDQAYYDKPANIFRAYLESIIAALSVTVPPIKCYPDNADDPMDLLTAKAGDKISQLVFRHNDAPLLWLHALFVYCTEGMVGAYNYTKRDKDYGTYETKKYEEIEELHEYKICPICGMEIDDRIVNQEEDEFQPDDDDIALHNIQFNEGMELCPQCMMMVDPQLQRNPLIITRLVGITHEPKARQCLEVYGLLNIKVSNWARKQCECPYLFYSYETHYANVLEEYPDLRDDQKSRGNIIGGTGGGFEPYERWARLSPQYRGEYPENNVTVRKCWLRPAAFNVLDEDRCKEMKRLFPDGAKVVLVNDEYASSCNESLDDHWTLTYNPLADYVNFDPLGMLLVSLQDITNDLISLILQTIEHGIPQTFVDPSVLNMNQYRQLQATPGSLIPTKTLASNRKVADGFYEVKTATLSAEVLPFANMVQELSQLVSGALPSLFGGALQGGGETASEYSMSRAQALQRLQTSWKIITIWWKNIFGKIIPQYIKDFEDEERDVQRKKDGSFINVVIKKAELEGKLGKVELEANENLPLTWTQTKDLVMQLLQSANPEILQILGSAENLPVIRDAIGLTDFFVPGEDDRTKQYEEINILLNTQPIEMPPTPEQELMSMETGQPATPQPMPSVEIDPEMDDHAVEFEICRAWAVSEAGRQAKVENPQGYANVLLHAKQHLMMVQQAMMAQQAQEAMGSAPNAKPNKKSSTPIKEESDVKVQ